jgi:prevent-host-death family protein
MLQVNILEAKTRLSSLVDSAVRGKPFIIAKAGKPMVKVVSISIDEPHKQRIGFMKGEISVPADFDSMGKKEVENLFAGAL